jgi:hypothetical protein
MGFQRLRCFCETCRRYDDGRARGINACKFLHFSLPYDRTLKGVMVMPFPWPVMPCTAIMFAAVYGSRYGQPG